jgi:hypothetical protein
MEATKEKGFTVNEPEEIAKQIGYEDKIFSTDDLINHVNSQDGLELYEHLRITDTTPVPDLIPFFSINDQMIGANGDLIILSGDSKGGKTGVIEHLICGSISVDGDILDTIENAYIRPNPDKRAVIHIDTEQSRTKQKQKQKAIIRRGKFNPFPKNYLAFNFVALDLQEMIPTLKGIIRAAKKEFGGIHSAFIDGVADFMSDVNDQRESDATIKVFHQIALENDCPVYLIIHTNPNSSKQRGHAGSQLQRKGSSVLVIKKDGEFSYLEPQYLRHTANHLVPSIKFTYDQTKGYHVSCGTKSDEKEDRSRIRFLNEIVDSVFAPPTSLEYSDAIKGIQAATGKSERTAKDYFKDIKEVYKLIVKGADQRWRKAV